MYACCLFLQYVLAMIPFVWSVQILQLVPVLRALGSGDCLCVTPESAMAKDVACNYSWNMQGEKFQFLPAPGTCIGGVLSPESTSRKKVCKGGSSPSPHTVPKQQCWPLRWAQVSFVYNLNCGCSRLQSLQAVFAQPTPVLSPGLISKVWTSTSGPCLHQWMHISGWGAQGCGDDSLCKYLSILSAINWLLHSAPRHQVSHQSQLISPLKGTSQGTGAFSLSQLPPKGHRSHPNSFLSLSLSFFFCLTWLCGDFLAVPKVWDLLPAFEDILWKSFHT